MNDSGTISKEDAKAIACGLLHDGINADKLSEKARAEIRRAIDRLIALTSHDDKATP